MGKSIRTATITDCEAGGKKDLRLVKLAGKYWWIGPNCDVTPINGVTVKEACDMAKVVWGNEWWNLEAKWVSP